MIHVYGYRELQKTAGENKDNGKVEAGLAAGGFVGSAALSKTKAGEKDMKMLKSIKSRREAISKKGKPMTTLGTLHQRGLQRKIIKDSKNVLKSGNAKARLGLELGGLAAAGVGAAKFIKSKRDNTLEKKAGLGSAVVGLGSKLSNVVKKSGLAGAASGTGRAANSSLYRRPPKLTGSATVKDDMLAAQRRKNVARGNTMDFSSGAM